MAKKKKVGKHSKLKMVRAAAHSFGKKHRKRGGKKKSHKR